jgi:hypothetical protein
MTRKLIQVTDLESGVIVREEYLRDKKRHRNPREGPAFIERDRVTGIITAEEYWVNAVLHREDGPARIGREADGNVFFEEYCFNGQLHRNSADGPAVVVRSWDTGIGIVLAEEYYWCGKFHRDCSEGPARIFREMDTGKLYNEEYWVDGKAVTAPRHRACQSQPMVRKSRPSPYIVGLAVAGVTAFLS